MHAKYLFWNLSNSNFDLSYLGQNKFWKFCKVLIPNLLGHNKSIVCGEFRKILNASKRNRKKDAKQKISLLVAAGRQHTAELAAYFSIVFFFF